MALRISRTPPRLTASRWARKKCGLTKEFFGFSPDESFVVPPGVREHFAARMGARGAGLSKEWDGMFARYKAQYPDLADNLERMKTRDLPPDWEKALPTFPAERQRNVDARCFRQSAERGGAERSLTCWAARRTCIPAPRPAWSSNLPATSRPKGELGNYKGRNFHFGIREHAMCAIVNGMVLTGLRAFGSGFLIFTDYARGSLRLSSLMDIPALHIWTHDTISLGEDGPTHQPIEQLVSLRAVPGMIVIRPADANEMVEAYRIALVVQGSSVRTHLQPAGSADLRPQQVCARPAVWPRALTSWWMLPTASRT